MLKNSTVHSAYRLQVGYTFDIITSDVRCACTCVGIHPGRVEPASPTGLTTSRKEALQPRQMRTSYYGHDSLVTFHGWVAHRGTQFRRRCIYWQLKPSLSGFKSAGASALHIHTLPFGLDPDDATDRSLVGRGVLATLPFGPF